MRLLYILIFSLFFMLGSIYHAQNTEYFSNFSLQTPDTAFSVAWSPDGEKLAVGGFGIIWIYSFGGEQLATLDTLSGITITLEWNKESNILVSSSFPSSYDAQDSKTIAWDTINYVEIWSRTDIDEFKLALDYLWLSNSQYILGGNGVGDIFVIKTDTGELEKNQTIESSNVNFRPHLFIYAFCQEIENEVITITDFGVYSVNTVDLSHELIISNNTRPGDCNKNSTILVNPKGYLTRLDNLSNSIISLENNRLLPYSTYDYLDMTVKWNPVYPIMASYVEAGLFIWDIFKINIVQIDNIYRATGPENTHSIAWHPNGEYLAQAGKDGAYVNIWHITMEDLLNS